MHDMKTISQKINEECITSNMMNMLSSIHNIQTGIGSKQTSFPCFIIGHSIVDFSTAFQSNLTSNQVINTHHKLKQKTSKLSVQQRLATLPVTHLAMP